MDRITTEMAEHICDNLCKYPNSVSEDELIEHCSNCKMGRFVCDILNEHNKINDFEKTKSYKLFEKKESDERD